MKPDNDGSWRHDRYLSGNERCKPRGYVLELRRGKGSRRRPPQIHHPSYQHYNCTGRRFPDRLLPFPQRRAIILRLLVLAVLLAVAYAFAPR
jgi:hypothetical protein